MPPAQTNEPNSKSEPIARQPDASPRVLIITPVRDEAAHVDALVKAMAAQTLPPDSWIVVDDGSTDGTLERLRALEMEVPFMRTIVRPQITGERVASDRLATGSCIRAFNFALSSVGRDGFEYLGKLDGDIELPPDYFERLLARFELDPSLGIACGDIVEGEGSEWKRVAIPPHHVHGALKLYRRECFEAISPLWEALGWDTIDEMYARMKGFRTRSFREIVVRHHRPIGARDGLLRGRARHGECAYISHFTPTWVTLRSLKLATKEPVVMSGFAFLYGYGRALFRRTPRVPDDAFRAFVHQELRQRMLAALRLPILSGRH